MERHTAPLPRVDFVVDSDPDYGMSPANRTVDLETNLFSSFQFLNEIIGGEKMCWSDPKSLPQFDAGAPRRGPPDPFVCVCVNGESIKLPLDRSSMRTTTEATAAMSPAFDLFPSRQFYDVAVTAHIPFPLPEGVWSDASIDVYITFIRDPAGGTDTASGSAHQDSLSTTGSTPSSGMRGSGVRIGRAVSDDCGSTSGDAAVSPGRKRSMRCFLGTLTGDCAPLPVFREKVLFKPTQIHCSLVYRKSDCMADGAATLTQSNSGVSAAEAPSPSSPNSPCVHEHKLIATLLQLLELSCVTGTGPYKATRLRSDIKETASNDLITQGLHDTKWTEFLKKLHNQGHIHLISKGQENWVCRPERANEVCSNFAAERQNIATCMVSLLENHGTLTMPALIDKLYTHSQARTDLWRMMTPNWKTLRRVLLRPDARRQCVEVDPSGHDRVQVFLTTPPVE
eukprot:TRINITY_DN1562_c1_g3_i1.p1 TRINITY_DN1562_c1_g3~~TRINITY_DN1562_c1_g3_i1.p1  ORF type:complete len:453 (+),score=37.62 TRINITY_DN1562_c1_g3_i1:101-1459(+)